MNVGDVAPSTRTAVHACAKTAPHRRSRKPPVIVSPRCYQGISVGGATELRLRRAATLISQACDGGCGGESDGSGDTRHQAECSQVAGRQDPSEKASDGKDQEEALTEDHWLATAARADEQQDADDTKDQPDQTDALSDRVR